MTAAAPARPDYAAIAGWVRWARACWTSVAATQLLRYLPDSGASQVTAGDRRRPGARVRRKRRNESTRTGTGLSDFEPTRSIRDPLRRCGVPKRADLGESCASARGHRHLSQLRLLEEPPADRRRPHAGVGEFAVPVVQHAQRAPVHDSGLRGLLLAARDPRRGAQGPHSRPARNAMAESLRRACGLSLRQWRLIGGWFREAPDPAQQQQARHRDTVPARKSRQPWLAKPPVGADRTRGTPS